VALSAEYPHLDIYPSVYPIIVIYPSYQDAVTDDAVDVALKMAYPRFDIYPAAYPFFDIYRSGVCFIDESGREPQSVKLDHRYPKFNIYPPVYPHFDIYNTGRVSVLALPNRDADVFSSAHYPSFNLYPAVYPHFDLYPMATQSRIMPPRRLRKTHKELHDLVMAARIERQVPQADVVGRKVVEDREVQSSSESTARSVPSAGLSTTASLPPKSTLPPTVGIDTVPVRPSDIRRTVSLTRPSSKIGTSAVDVVRASSLRRLPSVDERFSGPSVQSYPVDALDQQMIRKKRRDSIVLEKARHWGASAVPQSQPSQLTMNDLSEFPMPPLPPIPGKTSSPSRPVAKLDKSKLPFK